MTLLMTLLLAAPASAETTLRLLEPPFTREECETYILSPRGELDRRKSVKWLASWHDIPMTPVTSHGPLLDPEIYTPDFAVFAAPPGTGREELRRLKAEADARHVAWRTSSTAAPPPPPAKPLTPLQEMILGVGSGVDVPSDQLETTLSARGPDTFVLRTTFGDRVLGERELDLANARLGYAGDPYYWVYQMIRAREADDEGDAPLTIDGFLSERGVYVLKAKEPTRPEIYYVLQVFNGPDGLGNIEAIEIEAFTARPAHPARVEDHELHVPPFLDGEGRASKFTPLGFKLLTTLD